MGASSGQVRLFAADDESLLQHVLAAQASVAGTVGEDDPGRPGGNLPVVLGAILLEHRVFLHGVVNLEHERVVRGTIDHRQAHLAPAFTAVRLQASTSRGTFKAQPAKATGQPSRTGPKSPRPWPLGMDVQEDPQQAIAVRRPSRK